MARPFFFAFNLVLSGACAAPTPNATNDTPPTAATTASASGLPERLRDAQGAIAEAYALVDTFGESLFARWPDAPKDIMLIDDGVAWSFCAPVAAEGWVRVGQDTVTGCQVWRAPATHPSDSTDTLIASNNRPTVVIGTPRTLGLSSGRFVLTLVGERLHQLQMSTPDYRSALLNLGLHEGNETETLIADYDFPFQNREVRKRLLFQGVMLAGALRSPTPLQNRRFLDGETLTYLSARKATMDYLSDADARYVELLLWREGVARYAQLAMADRAVMRKTHDYAALAKTIRAELIAELEVLSVWRQGRAIFDAIGAGEALFLDRYRPQWRREYLAERFTLAKWFVRKRKPR